MCCSGTGHPRKVSIPFVLANTVTLTTTFLSCEAKAGADPCANAGKRSVEWATSVKRSPTNMRQGVVGLPVQG